MTQPDAARRRDQQAAAPFLRVSRETWAALEIYEARLDRWRHVTNLIGPQTWDHLWLRHFADSAQLLTIRPNARTWVDLGSGAGFPGLVLAILLRERIGAAVHLIESDARKCAFLRDVSRETSAPATIHHGRAETVVPALSTVEIVTARAVAPLAQLVAWSAPLLEKGGEGLFLKGRTAAHELTGVEEAGNLSLTLIPSLTDPAASIVAVRRLPP